MHQHHQCYTAASSSVFNHPTIIGIMRSMICHLPIYHLMTQSCIFFEGKNRRNGWNFLQYRSRFHRSFEIPDTQYPFSKFGDWRWHFVIGKLDIARMSFGIGIDYCHCFSLYAFKEPEVLFSIIQHRLTLAVCFVFPLDFFLCCCTVILLCSCRKKRHFP